MSHLQPKGQGAAARCPVCAKQVATNLLRDAHAYGAMARILVAHQKTERGCFAGRKAFNQLCPGSGQYVDRKGR